MAAALSVVLVLLALNGVVVDVTGDAGIKVGIGRAITRLATVVLAGYVVWLWYRSSPTPGGGQRTSSTT
jgi:hypothetical protein